MGHTCSKCKMSAACLYAGASRAREKPWLDAVRILHHIDVDFGVAHCGRCHTTFATLPNRVVLIPAECILVRVYVRDSEVRKYRCAGCDKVDQALRKNTTKQRRRETRRFTNTGRR